MVSANEKLPDIVFGTANDMMVAKYGASGVYIDLMPYYDEHSVYIKEQFEKNDMYRKLCTFADGKMYSVGRLQEQSHTDYGNKFFINQQWLAMVIRYGEEGVDWEWVPEGTKCQFESSGYPATFRLLSTAQTGVQNKWWNVWSPMYLPYEIGNGWADDDDPLNIFRIAYDTVGKLQGYIPDEVVGKITYTIAESEQISEILSNLNTAYVEWMTLFVIGDRNIEAEWDDYLAELEKIGIAQYLEVTQTAYERTYGK